MKTFEASKAVIQACERHLSDLEKSFTEKYPYQFERTRAKHIFDFFERFGRHSKGELAGQPIELELWEKFILGSILGWTKKEDSTRRFSLAYVQIARKNGKSLISSGLSNYMFLIDDEPGAECYTASVKRDTAKIVWLDAMRMIKASPVLRKHVKIRESYNTMTSGNRVLKALSADSGQDGLNVQFFSLDEYHLMKNNEMFEVLVSGMGARRQPLGFIITTAGESRGGTSPAYQTYEYAKRILNKDVDNENYFVYIAELDSEEEVHDPSKWIKANPNLDVSVSMEYLQESYTRAVDGGEMDNFLTKNMNMWIDRRDAYFPLNKWREDELPNLEGKLCYVGVDLSSTLDLTSVSAVFPLDNKEFAVLNHNFMPQNSLYMKENMDHVPYRKWANDGFLTLTTGDAVDVEFVFEYIMQLTEKYDVKQVHIDPWNATALMTMLANAGVEVIETRQGYMTLSEPTKFLKKLMIQQRLIHGNNPVYRWCTANAIPKYDANENVMLDKAKSINRIDAVASTITAMTGAYLHDYEESLDEHILDDEFTIW